MTKTMNIQQIDKLLELLRGNVEKIDKRLSDAIKKQPDVCQVVEDVKKKSSINKKSIYIIIVLITIVLIDFYYSISAVNISVNIPKIQNPFEGDTPAEYDFVNF